MKTVLGVVALVLALLLGGARLLAFLDTLDDEPMPDVEIVAVDTAEELLLLSSLPVAFSGGGDLLDTGSPLMSLLQSEYRVETIAVADQASLEGHDLILMAHPAAQPAEALVDFDNWVRAGGKVVLLADPRLEYESGQPLGAPLAPPPFFADTGLLGRWGVRLTGPEALGAFAVPVGERLVYARAPGRFAVEDGGRCSLEAEGFIALCDVGEGQALLVADADFVMEEGEIGDSNRALLVGWMNVFLD
ncbi:hypothetical protein [Sphingomicrobium sediminis]|uniref:Uncharacterized protein n=1 Tax=Sphingomicrobium sediminis TaxID=2950949 RepID=A0A9X2J4U3_9SPHN|nr:hypothetical protein [Sphingomicrobium sediminis]MCM8557577.1 hypothetical protein [Sphingomicrobium sediminis]